MARKERNWHEDFIEYTNFIVNHPNYKGIPEPYKKDGSVRWVVSGNSILGKERAGWWDDKVESMHLTNRAEVARTIHPKELNGLKPCQICGKKLSIHYVYPNKNTLKKINDIFDMNFQSYTHDIIQIFEIIYKARRKDVFDGFRHIFKIPTSVDNNEEDFINYINEQFIKKSNKGKLSPGVMSNPPDRFDGFHTYNACCRSKEDTGRHKSNLSRYSQDRRAYENWAEGDYRLSNRLMGEYGRFSKKVPCPNCGNISKMTADHIGPISLGFTHRPKFNPLCKTCNSAKNNRMTFNDVQTIITDEKNGETVISWHSKYLWDSLKNEISNDKDALKLSKVMREHLHNVLSVLAIINEKGYRNFLKDNFLHPEYSHFDYKFENFNPLNLEELKIIKTPLNSANTRKNAQRYLRISFEELHNYKLKENRKVKFRPDSEVTKMLDFLFRDIERGDNLKSLKTLNEIVWNLSKKSIEKFYS
ncbi:MAG: hypothetical protein ABFC34_03900 [Methanobacterium sp.]